MVNVPVPVPPSMVVAPVLAMVIPLTDAVDPSKSAVWVEEPPNEAVSPLPGVPVGLQLAVLVQVPVPVFHV